MGIITSLQETIETETESLFEAKDGSNIHITSEDAYSLVSVHDSLSLENQKKMRDLLEESGDNFFKVLSFCHERLIEED